MGKFVIKPTATGFTFRLKARNGEVIATSEVYSSDASCRKGIQSVINNAPVAAIEDQTVEGYAIQKHLLAKQKANAGKTESHAAGKQ